MNSESNDDHNGGGMLVESFISLVLCVGAFLGVVWFIVKISEGM